MNVAAFWLTTGAGERIPRVIEERLNTGSGSGSSVRSGSTETSKEREANERLAVFLGLVFAHPVRDADGKMTSLTLAVFTDEVKEVFGSVTKAAEQARTMAENMSTFAELESQCGG